MNKYKYSYGRVPATQIPSDPASICKGGWYMHQSGPTASYCKNLLSTTQGILYYNMNTCSKHGTLMGRPLNYERIFSPPLSDINWKNGIKCMKPQN